MKKALLLLSRILAVVIFWGLVWILLSKRIGNDFLFPSPSSVFAEFGRLFTLKDFWLTTSLSLLRVLWGILISWVIGSALAYLLYVSRVLNVLISPMLTAIKSTPVASFIVLALLWLDRGVLPVLITSLIVIPIVWANVTEGIRSVDQSLVEVTRVYRFPLRKRITSLYVPSIAPYFMAACKSSLGMAWKAGIAAEVLATPEYSIGTELYFSKAYLETPTLFAWTLVVIVLSILIEKLLVLGLERLGARLHLLPKGGQYAENQ